MNTLVSRMRGKLLGLGGELLLATGVVHANGTVTYVYTDPQGTPLAEADVNGNITATFDYAPYGSIALGTAPNGPGYTGHVNDPDTGLVYMQARYYDPSVGRFLSVDPVAPSAGNAFKFNRFAYANNNPIDNMDPDGRDPVDDGGIAGPGYRINVNPSSSEGGGKQAHALASTAYAATNGGENSGASPPMDKSARVGDALLSLMAPTAANIMKKSNNPTRLPDGLPHQMFMTGAKSVGVATAVGGVATIGGIAAAPFVSDAAVAVGRTAMRTGPRAVMVGCISIACTGKELPEDYSRDRIIMQEVETNAKIVGSEIYHEVFEGGKD